MFLFFCIGKKSTKNEFSTGFPIVGCSKLLVVGVASWWFSLSWFEHQAYSSTKHSLSGGHMKKPNPSPHHVILQAKKNIMKSLCETIRTTVDSCWISWGFMGFTYTPMYRPLQKKHRKVSTHPRSTPPSSKKNRRTNLSNPSYEVATKHALGLMSWSQNDKKRGWKA